MLTVRSLVQLFSLTVTQVLQTWGCPVKERGHNRGSITFWSHWIGIPNPPVDINQTALTAVSGYSFSDTWSYSFRAFCILLHHSASSLYFYPKSWVTLAQNFRCRFHIKRLSTTTTWHLAGLVMCKGVLIITHVMLSAENK